MTSRDHPFHTTASKPKTLAGWHLQRCMWVHIVHLVHSALHSAQGWIACSADFLKHEMKISQEILLAASHANKECFPLFVIASDMLASSCKFRSFMFPSNLFHKLTKGHSKQSTMRWLSPARGSAFSVVRLTIDFVFRNAVIVVSLAVALIALGTGWAKVAGK